MNYKDKYFYIPSVHAIVYCHDEDETGLILSGNCVFVRDAKTDTSRQFITHDNFKALNPKEIDLRKMDAYKFLEISTYVSAYRVTKWSKDDEYRFIWPTLSTAEDRPSVRPKPVLLSPKFQHR